MRREWDEARDRANQSKRGISFDTACLVFDDPLHLAIRDRHAGAEERWRTLGMAGGAVVLVVAHTWREDAGGVETIRIISARKATAHERRHYEQGYRETGARAAAARGQAR